MGLSKSLNAFINWRKVLSLLEVTTDTHALPARVLCPLCTGHHLLIFPDNVLGGQWYSCEACGSKGDIIQLAARCWNLSILATVKKLVAAGSNIPSERTTENYIHYYETNHVDLPATIEELLVKSYGKIQLPDTISLTKQYGWRLEGSASWRKKGADKLVAGLHYSEIDAVLWPGSYRSGGMTPGKYVNNPSATRIFKGRGWGDILVLPHYDVPGRICALKIIGRKGDPSGDVLFKTVLKKREATEAGLAGHPSVLKSEGDTIFAFSDYAVGTRLQMRHMGMNPNPLQIVLWHKDDRHESKNCWNMLGHRKVVVCSESFTAEAVLQAIHCDGRFSLISNIDYGQPSKTLERAEDKSEYWPDAFNSFAETATDSELEEFVYRLPDVAIKRIFDKVELNAKERLKMLAKFKAAGRTVTIGNRTIEERGDCWYWSQGSKTTYMQHASESLLSDAVLRIDRVIHISRSKKTYYQGRVKYRGEVIPFCEDRKKIDKKPFAWAQELLLAKGKGLLRYSSWWEKVGIDLTLLFKNPVFTQGCDIVGWNEDSGSFELPYYIIGESGVKRREYETIAQDTPATNIQNLTELTPEEMDRLTEPTRDNIAFWASWCACVSNILAPAFNHPTRGVGVVGDMAVQGMQQAARALGCIRKELSNISADKILRLRSTAENRHAWPLIVGLEGRSTEYTTMNWINRKPDHNDVAVISIDQALGLLVTGGWYVVVDVGEAAGGMTNKVKDRLVLNYLKHIMQNKLINVYQGGEILDSVFSSVTSWASGYHANTQVFEKARELLSACDKSKTSAAFGRLLSRWYNSGLFEVSNGSDANKLARKLDDGVFISKPKVIQLWEKRRLPKLDVERLTECLMIDDILVKELDLSDSLGWLVSTDWWHENVQRGPTTNLRVYEG